MLFYCFIGQLVCFFILLIIVAFILDIVDCTLFIHRHKKDLERIFYEVKKYEEE